MIKIHLLILFFPLQMQVMWSAKQHRKYDSIKSVERNKYDSCAHHWRFYFKELPKNKVFQVKNSYDNFWNILFICYLLLLFDFTRPLGPHRSISHWAPILVGTPLLKAKALFGLQLKFIKNFGSKVAKLQQGDPTQGSVWANIVHLNVILYDKLHCLHI